VKKELRTKLKVDSREQKNLIPEFDKKRFDEIIVEGLPFADYWFSWTDDKDNEVTVPICFERKSLNDCFGTMTSGYDRFKRELERCKENKFHMILAIEGSIRDVHKGCSYSKFSGESMLKKLAMLRVRYDLEVLFFEDRRSMARWIEEVFDAVWRNYAK